MTHISCEVGRSFVYGDLSTGGSKLGLTPETVAELERAQRPAPDLIFGIESAFRFGFMKLFPILPFGSSARAFGHTGSGGRTVRHSFATSRRAQDGRPYWERAGWLAATEPLARPRGAGDRQCGRPPESRSTAW